MLTVSSQDGTLDDDLTQISLSIKHPHAHFDMHSTVQHHSCLHHVRPQQYSPVDDKDRVPLSSTTRLSAVVRSALSYYVNNK